jgi:hypothetical protein
MTTSSQPAREPARAHYAGAGRGWFVTRRYTLDGYPQTFTLAGPFTSRAQADEHAAEVNREPEPEQRTWPTADELRAEGISPDTGRPYSEDRYVVVENTPGYLPEEDEPATFADRDSARAYMLERVASYRESLDEIGDEHDTCLSEDGDSAYVVSTSRAHDLGRSFEVLPLEQEGSV